MVHWFSGHAMTKILIVWIKMLKIRRQEIHSHAYLGSRIHSVCLSWENTECKMFTFRAPVSKGNLSEAVHNHLCRRRVLKGSECQRPVVARGLFCQQGIWGTQRLRPDGQDASLQRDTSSEVSLGSFGELHGCGWRVLVCVLCRLNHKRWCVSMCMCLHLLGGATHGAKWIPVDKCFQDSSLWIEGEKGREMMMRVGGGWADGVQRGWSCLLMKSHLRPPVTLNMGHCSCPDLGFDPQRFLTPTIPPELTSLPSGQHAYVYICVHTHRYICMYTYVEPYKHARMSTQVQAVGLYSPIVVYSCLLLKYLHLRASNKSQSLSSVITKEKEGKQGTAWKRTISTHIIPNVQMLYLMD